MRVHVAASTSEIEHPEDFGSLAVVTDLRNPALGAALTDQDLGALDGGGAHVWLLPEAVRRLGPPTSEWSARFDEMCAFARAHGWVDEHGRVRAHVERATNHP